jgi:hypothetical protein
VKSVAAIDVTTVLYKKFLSLFAINAIPKTAENESTNDKLKIVGGYTSINIEPTNMTNFLKFTFMSNK